jgi:LL-diaminopimelate aminotransferase
MKKASARMQKSPGNFFAELESRITALQADGCDIIRLDIGSPDLPPAPFILETLEDFAHRPDSHGYQPHAGPPELRQAWAHMYQQVYGVELDPQTEIVPLLGSKEGIFHLTQAWIDPGDAVLVPDPGYMTYARAAAFAAGEVVLMPLLPKRGYLPDFEAIPAEALRRAKMLWLNYPNNPTAAVADLGFFAQAVAFARQNDLLLCHDAAYTQVTFDGKHAPSILEIPGAKEVAIEMNSLSKSHNLAGWRLGVCVGNPAPLSALFRLKTNLDSGHFLPVLEGAIQAMTGDQDWIQERNQVYRQRRDILLPALHACGLPAKTPQASIYIWCPVPEGWSSQDFTSFLLDSAHVSVTPGTVFGRRGEGFVRLALGIATERISQAAERIVAVSKKMERR